MRSWQTFLAIIVAVLLLSMAATTRVMRNLTRSDAASGGGSASFSARSASSSSVVSRRSTVPPAEDGEHEEQPRQPRRRPTSASTDADADADADASTNQKSTRQKKTKQQQRSAPPLYAAGRDREQGNEGLQRHPESGVRHAWGVHAEDRALKCHGTDELPDCTTRAAYEYAQKHILFVIVTGGDATFRVEVSDCTWLGKLPPDNVFVVTDVLPHEIRTRHRWMAAELPDGMRRQDNGDFVSDYMPRGYLKAVRDAGQGYGAGWIAAQTRFTYGLKRAAAAARANADVKWVLLMDDDTIVQLDHLVDRVRGIDERAHPWYFSRKGWGGAGHLYSRNAMGVLHARLHECEDKWFVRQFRASDTLLLKCAGHLRLRTQLEATMSHCPASSQKGALENPRQVTMHLKKDFYPPVLLATWRVALYYLAMYCRSPKAIRDVVEWSQCTYGASCKRAGCDAVADRRRAQNWLHFSKNNTLRVLPVVEHYAADIRVPTRVANASAATVVAAVDDGGVVTSK